MLLGTGTSSEHKTVLNIIPFSDVNVFYLIGEFVGCIWRPIVCIHWQILRWGEDAWRAAEVKVQKVKE